jgi:hypothetical protein
MLIASLWMVLIGGSTFGPFVLIIVTEYKSLFLSNEQEKRWKNAKK